MSVELFNEKQGIAYDEIMGGRNIYLGGPGGVGKSFVTNVLREKMGNRAIFIAPTGIAALNIQGATFHSTFGLPMGVCNKFTRNKVSKKVEELFGDDLIKTIVMDEISMVRADVMATVDNVLRLVKRKNIPFGGLQIVPVGDFCQLSPVVKNGGREAEAFYEEFESPYCFSTESWMSADFKHIELTDVVRQDDEVMINNLQQVRMDTKQCKEAIEYFNSNCLLRNKINAGIDPDDIDGDSTFLCTTNANADAINKSEYEDLEGEEKVYFGKTYGSFREKPAPKVLPLKIGTKVMITANDVDKTYFNGEIGYVSNMTDDYVEVMVDENTTYRVKKYRWVEYEYKRNASGSLVMEEKASFIQFPLKHGYALTIHKSQGCTLDNGIIDLGRGAFAHGQTYVALSRMRSLAGITLTKEINNNDIIYDKDVRDFYAGKFNNILA